LSGSYKVFVAQLKLYRIPATMGILFRWAKRIYAVIILPVAVEDRALLESNPSATATYTG